MTPIPVIFVAPRQAEAAQRLREYCERLDCTLLRAVVTAFGEPNLPYPDICNWAFRQTAKTMQDHAFIWLEPDSIPLKPGWVDALAAEWQVAQSLGKEILWTTDSNPPHDLCTGIGVYGPGFVRHLDLEAMKGQGFDGWILKNLPHLIHKTPLIQHSYGVYDETGHATLHRNPVPRPDAVIFHKDQFQDLIP